MNEKEKIQAEIEAKMTSFNETINELKAAAEKQKEKYGAVHHESIAKVEEKKQRAQKKLEELAASNEHDWHRLDEELKGFMEDIDDSLRQALAYFK